MIEWCEKERVARGLPEIGYEVGTEETNGGLTSTDKYHTFIERLKDELVARSLPMPTFIVGQTGTLTRLTKQVGHYDFEAAYSLAKMARSYGVGLKEHNADYLDDVTLLEHTPANVTASNVAPQYGTEETRAYLKLCDVEDLLVREGLLASDKVSGLRKTLLVKAIETERWRKWMVGDQVNLSVEEILANEKLSLDILDISGHYAFNDPEVKAATEKLYANLAAQNIDGQRFVVDHIKRPLRQYVECYRLKGATSRILEALAK